jgi:hypothetical protein
MYRKYPWPEGRVLELVDAVQAWWKRWYHPTELLLLAYMGSCLLDHLPELPPPVTSATYCYRSALHTAATGHLPNKLLLVSYLSSSSSSR